MIYIILVDKNSAGVWATYFKASHEAIQKNGKEYQNPATRDTGRSRIEVVKHTSNDKCHYGITDDE